jgi:hypothetical protein
VVELAEVEQEEVLEEVQQEEQVERAQRRRGSRRVSMCWAFNDQDLVVEVRVVVRAGRCLRWRISGWRLVNMGLISAGESFIGDAMVVIMVMGGAECGPVAEGPWLRRMPVVEWVLYVTTYL